MDNEKSDMLDGYFRQNKVTVEYVPPGDHCTNPAERASLATCRIIFPPDLWHLLLPTLELALNSMRPWAPDPTKSARTGMFGLPFDFSTHPLHAVGQLCVAHAAPKTRNSWDQHGWDPSLTITGAPGYS